MPRASSDVSGIAISPRTICDDQKSVSGCINDRVDRASEIRGWSGAVEWYKGIDPLIIIEAGL